MIARISRRRTLGLAVLLLLAACAPQAAIPIAPLESAAGQERLKNGTFEAGQEGWAPESEGGGAAPQVGPEFGHTSAGMHFDTPAKSAGVSAVVQEFEPATDFTLDFWVRPQRGSSRIGLQSDPTTRGLSTSRIVFLDAGEPGATVVLTAWDVNYTFQTPLEAGTWYRVRVKVDGERGVQQFDFNGSHIITLTSAQPVPSRAIVVGDRQPRTEAYVIERTKASVKDGLNGSYDYDDIALHVTR